MKVAYISVFTKDETASILAMKDAAKHLVINDIINPYNKFTAAYGYGKTHLSDKMVVAGGFFASYIQDELPNDFDIFILNADMTKISYVRDFIRNVEHFDNDSFHENRYDMDVSQIVKTMSATRSASDGIKVYDHFKFQFIFTKYETRAELLDHFDFEHTKNVYSVHEDKLYISRAAFDAARDKKLRFTIPEENIDEYRTKKFLERGYTW